MEQCTHHGSRYPLSPVQTTQFTMGGCCSKCGIYPLKSDIKGDSVKTGDTPKLSRLQHKESFNGAAKLRTKDADQATPKDDETVR